MAIAARSTSITSAADAVAFEGVAGGFAAIYPVLSALENQGKLRRGYFIAGLGGSQFADPGALERLRELAEISSDENHGVVLSAVDPANPYGAVLPWPRDEARLARVPGAHVVLVNGLLAAFVSRDQAELRIFLPSDEPSRSSVARAAACALAGWARKTARPGLGWSAEEAVPAARGPLAPYLLEAGFETVGPGFRLRPSE